MRIAIAADHNGVALKHRLVEHLTALGHDVNDRGVDEVVEVDYPRLCADIGHHVGDGIADRGIMIGGTGSGETIALNKIDGVRATLCERVFLAEIARANNDGNVLVLGAKITAPDLAMRIVDRWLTTDFTGGKHARRLAQIAAMERGESI
ncbi:RpiB/LacA/LacB family sugar-phosphate isomerase [Egicoccus sp. AB-alg2]|uniref:RpiB/LacA/LacB family sugar-phosphate isomerase n=1 Tax=Egicoccus sp. AB-alg2 TaxID=3242693 RepID=UPI00359EBCB4